jgi:hypothetical protein
VVCRDEVGGWTGRAAPICHREHKRRAYLALGLKEYWVVDAVTRPVEV